MFFFGTDGSVVEEDLLACVSTSSATAPVSPCPEGKIPDRTSPGGFPFCVSSVSLSLFTGVPRLLLLLGDTSCELKGSNSARIDASTRASGDAADEVGLRLADGLNGERRLLLVSAGAAIEHRASKYSQLHVQLRGAVTLAVTDLALGYRSRGSSRPTPSVCRQCRPIG
jgi:hypothetical protein